MKDKFYADCKRTATLTLVLLIVISVLCAVVLVLDFTISNLALYGAMLIIALVLYLTSLADRRTSKKIYLQILSGEDDIALIAVRSGVTVETLKKTLSRFLQKGYIENYVIEKERLVRKSPKKKK